MPVRLAHLSDVHFGRGFDFALWSAVKDEVVTFRPDLLVVSGDMVDDPHPIQLLAAKCELREFAARAQAELVVVPGNHDVYASGLYTRLTPRQDWFDRIFFNDTTEAEEAAAIEYGAPLGFRKEFLWPAPVGSKLVDKLWYRFANPGAFAKKIPAVAKQPLVRRPANCGVLLAVLDSNVPGQPIGFATGQVDKDDLVALRAELKAIDEGYLARICVVHHHVLPIAFSGGRLIGAEPLMVLHNAGTMLSLMAEHRFDIVLHGHKHVAQFARLDLSPRDEIGYPIAVVSAGSAALKGTGGPRDNCLNLITVSGAGRIEVESLFYGGGSGPSREGGSGGSVRYSEPMATTKRRAHIRARERHPIRCGSRTMAFEITETSDLLCDLTVAGLQSERQSPMNRREHRVALAEDSWFVEELLRLDRTRSSPGAALDLLPPPPASANGARRGVSRSFVVEAPPDSLRSGEFGYRVTWACANTVNMTRWECEQRCPPAERKHGWDEEWVGVRVAHPTEKLTITLRMPPSLAGTEPFLECQRPEAFPCYAVSDAGDANVEPDDPWPVDQEVTQHESSNFWFDPREGLWKLEVANPMVGYNYRIKWGAPADEPIKAVQAAISQHRATLLGAGDSPAAAWPGEARDAFEVLADAFEGLFARNRGNEKRSVDLFVYDADRVALRPVLSRRSWTQTPVRTDFEIPLGRGIAGAAFQQGRIVPWARTVTESPFVKPYPYEDKDGEPDVEMRSMIAIPIFHLSQIDAPRPPLWSCLGVACFGSSSEATAIPALMGADADGELMDDLRGARALAHASVDQILKHL